MVNQRHWRLLKSFGLISLFELNEINGFIKIPIENGNGRLAVLISSSTNCPYFRNFNHYKMSNSLININQIANNNDVFIRMTACIIGMKCVSSFPGRHPALLALLLLELDVNFCLVIWLSTRGHSVIVCRMSDGKTYQMDDVFDQKFLYTFLPVCHFFTLHWFVFSRSNLFTPTIFHCQYKSVCVCAQGKLLKSENHILLHIYTYMRRKNSIGATFRYVISCSQICQFTGCNLMKIVNPT